MKYRVDQFQVVIAGGGRLGEHALAPVAVHYADAFTPYGPIVASAEGLAFFNLRAASDVDAHWMPGSRDKLERRAGRSLAYHVEPSDGDGAEVGGATLTRVGAGHDDGLAAYALRLDPGASVVGPEPHGSGGQYYLVIRGGLLFTGQLLPPRSLLMVAAADEPPMIAAGPDGLEAVILQFPRRAARPRG